MPSIDVYFGFTGKMSTLAPWRSRFRSGQLPSLLDATGEQPTIATDLGVSSGARSFTGLPAEMSITGGAPRTSAGGADPRLPSSPEGPVAGRVALTGAATPRTDTNR